MTKQRRWYLLLLLSAACQRPQWLVHIATDASVPQFGDRLLIEMVDDKGRVSQDHRHLVSAEQLRTAPLAFGVAADGASSFLVRARLYREDYNGPDGNISQAFVDLLGRLPASVPIGVDHVALTLTLNCFGIGSDLSDPRQPKSCDPATAQLAPVPTLPRIAPDDALPMPGTWKPGQRQDCPSNLQIANDLACVPGGAFVLSGPTPKLLQDQPPRLAVVSPFLIDRDEMTVKQVVALLQTNLPQPGSNSTCTYTGTDTDRSNSAPFNCTDVNLASAICRARTTLVEGRAVPMRLPTNAEWEWVAGNLEQETKYSWGNDPAVCEHAVASRAAWLLEAGVPAKAVDAFFDCRQVNGEFYPWGPYPQGHPDSATLLGIRNLSGNLSEPVLDLYTDSYADPCWVPIQGRNWLDNPKCIDKHKTMNPNNLGPTIRGGHWRSPRALVATIRRDSLLNKSGNRSFDVVSDSLGIRCVAGLKDVMIQSASPPDRAPK